MAYLKNYTIKGDNDYSGGSHNPVTVKQQHILNVIEERTGCEFDGESSRDAYYFIKFHVQSTPGLELA